MWRHAQPKAGADRADPAPSAQDGGTDLLANPGRLRELDTEGQIRAAEAFERLFTYLAGWGVENDPPPEAIDDLAELDMTSGSKQVTRANWIRFFLMKDDDEAAAIIAAIMTLSVKSISKDIG